MSEMVRLDGNCNRVSFRQRIGWWEVRAYLVAKSQVLLTIALSNLNRVVDVRNSHAVVRNVLNSTTTASTLKITGESGRSTRPDLNARTVGSIRHADVVHVNVLDNINFAGILAQRTNTNTMATVADQVLNNDVGAVRLERNAIVAVVDMRVLNDNIVGTVRVPAIRVLSGVLALAAAEDVDVVEYNVGGVGNERVPLRTVSELQIGDGGAFRTNHTEENGAKDVDVLGVEVVPGLAVSVEGAAAVDVDVLTAELEESGGVLVDLLEGVGLPVVGVVCELDGSLDVFLTVSAAIS